ncbi:hypothetical protein ACHAPV_003225 [Trichoderma viride]
MAAKNPVIIIGAGIAGLSLARVLQENGIQVSVYESSSRSAAQGYGITLRSWAYGPLVDKLGINLDEFRSAVATDGSVGGTGEINPTMHDALTGKPLIEASPSQTGSPEGEFFRANRNRLREFLLRGVDCHFDYQLVSLDIDEGEELLNARFANGAVVTGSLVIGADGVFSKVEPSIASTMVYNGERQVPRSEFDSAIAPYMPHTNVHAAVAENTMIAITVTEKTETEVTLTWTYTHQPTETQSPATLLRESSAELQVAILDAFAALGQLAPPFSTALAPEKVRQDRLYHWLMRTMRPPQDGLKLMASKGVAVIGDAAHAMPIFAGEGGNHALVDAVKLGQHLADSYSPASIEAFIDEELPRWEMASVGSEKRSLSLHRPLKTWRALAEQAKKH